MKDQKILRKTYYRCTILLLFAVGSVISGCDILEPDSLNDPSEVQLKQNTIYAKPETTTIIDLQSYVKSKSDVRLEISSPPRLGSLKSLGNDLLEYTPNSGTKEGQDAILFSIFGENNMVVKEDSINIIITLDSGLPCSFQAVNDYLSDVSGSVIIDVLGNDIICEIDSSLLEVSLLDSSFGDSLMASYGTVEMLSVNRIRYTPGPDFEGRDQFIYRVLKPENLPMNGDPDAVSYAYVYIGNSGNMGQQEINDDFYSVDLESMQDSVFLDVTSNDVFPPATEIISFVVTQLPEGKINPEGIINYEPGYAFYYHFPENVQVGFTDHFIYEVCTSYGCQEAEVTIEAK